MQRRIDSYEQALEFLYSRVNFERQSSAQYGLGDFLLDRMRQLLHRSLDPQQRAADPENQVDGFLGAGLPAGSQCWSKAGWMSQARHDAAYIESEDLPPTLLVVFAEGAACSRDGHLLPEIARHLLAARCDG
jgi:hypothetical protein